MCLRIYTDYLHKASRYSSELTYLKTRITTSPKHMIGSQKQRLKHKTKERHKTTKEKGRNIKSTIIEFKIIINTYLS